MPFPSNNLLPSDALLPSDRPTVEVLSSSRQKLSPEDGYDYTDIEFVSDVDFDAYEVRVVPYTNSTIEDGVLIEQGSGVANPYTATIETNELLAAGVANGDNITKVFVIIPIADMTSFSSDDVLTADGVPST